MFDLIASAIAEEAAAVSEEITTAVEEVAAPVAQPGFFDSVGTWFQTAFKKFGSFPVWGWFVVAVLLILGAVLFISVRNNKKEGKKMWNVKMMSFGAVCMALSIVLSLIRLYRMPLGGSITPASMLPLIVFAYVYGAGPGIALGALHGILQFILDGGEFSFAGFLPNLLDYPLGFACLGLAGLFGMAKKANDNNTLSLILGTVVGVFGRFFCSFLSGWIFYGQYAPEGWNPLVYSAAYNAAYTGVECVICIILVVLIGNRLIKMMKTA